MSKLAEVYARQLQSETDEGIAKLRLHARLRGWDTLACLAAQEQLRRATERYAELRAAQKSATKGRP